MLDDIGAIAPPPPPAPEEHVEVGALRVPKRLAQWEREVTAASQAHAVPESLLYAVMERESRGGEALRPTSAAGTGDWVARRGRWLSVPGVLVAKTLPAGWLTPKDKNGNPLPPPYAIPGDGQGWGRGLMQLDFLAAQKVDWESAAVNIDAGAALLRVNLDRFHGQFPPAVAAYNCGPENVLRALSEGLSVDAFTTGGNYSTDVLAKRASYTQETAS